MAAARCMGPLSLAMTSLAFATRESIWLSGVLLEVLMK